MCDEIINALIDLDFPRNQEPAGNKCIVCIAKSDAPVVKRLGGNFANQQKVKEYLGTLYY